MTCVFCTDVRNAGQVVAEDDRLWIVLHDDWAVRGHAMVVWKKHVENVADLTLDEYVHFAAAHHRAERALLAATGAERAIEAGSWGQAFKLHTRFLSSTDQSPAIND